MLMGPRHGDVRAAVGSLGECGFASLGSAMPAPTGRTGQRSALQAVCATPGAGATRFRLAALGDADRRSALRAAPPRRRRSRDGRAPAWIREEPSAEAS